MGWMPEDPDPFAYIQNTVKGCPESPNTYNLMPVLWGFQGMNCLPHGSNPFPLVGDNGFIPCGSPPPYSQAGPMGINSL